MFHCRKKIDNIGKLVKTDLRSRLATYNFNATENGASLSEVDNRLRRFPSDRNSSLKISFQNQKKEIQFSGSNFFDHMSRANPTSKVEKKMSSPFELKPIFALFARYKNWVENSLRQLCKL
jgi:hypothetical protein